MLLSKTVKVKWNGNSKKWYEDKGYIYTKMKDEFEVKIEDLQKGSHTNIEILCDYCLEEGKETLINKPYKVYLNSHKYSDKDCCNNCHIKK